MSDLIERLRNLNDVQMAHTHEIEIIGLCREAADELEKTLPKLGERDKEIAAANSRADGWAETAAEQQSELHEVRELLGITEVQRDIAEENAANGLARLGEILRLLREQELDHGNCRDGACTACDAEFKLDDLVAASPVEEVTP